MNVKIFSLGDNALTIEFENRISVAANNHVMALARHLDENPFAGLIEIVPAYASLSVFYDVAIVRRNSTDFPTAFNSVKSFLETALQKLNDSEESAARLIEIPVCFDEEFAPDLKSIAALNRLESEEVIEIFLSKIYRVYMLRFLPGFAYMGEVDKRIAAPRKLTPRLKVPKGSVGIAGRQTGIYPFASPGGWQIIGRTNLEMFTPQEKSPTFLQAGDCVKFFSADF